MDRDFSKNVSGCRRGCVDRDFGKSNAMSKCRRESENECPRAGCSKSWSKSWSESTSLCNRVSRRKSRSFGHGESRRQNRDFC
jgi:hypothetical protein